MKRNHRKPKRSCDTRKYRYRTEYEALEHINWMLRNSEARVTPRRAYYCTKCGGWHATAKEADHAVN